MAKTRRTKSRKKSTSARPRAEMTTEELDRVNGGGGGVPGMSLETSIGALSGGGVPGKLAPVSGGGVPGVSLTSLSGGGVPGMSSPMKMV